jgi:thioredoxin 1
MKISYVVHYPLFIAAVCVLAACQQAPTPTRQTAAPIQQPKQMTVQPAPPPFDENADAKAAIESALRNASDDGIRVLITWGANDDSGSSLFLAAKQSPAVSESALFTDEYRSVNVDVGHLDRNVELAKSYGASLKANTLPALTVLDSAGKVLANTDAEALRPDGNPAAIDPQKIIAFLKSNKAPAPDAVKLFEAALKEARKEDKNVFVWFSAPW